MTENKLSIRVWGDFACFTRPELKVERVSYPIMTPSAARGILEAIFWKPEMYYLIDSITVVKRGNWTSIKRNELKSKISLSNASKWMTHKADIQPIYAGGGADDATPRNTLALRDVEYIITAEIHLTQLGSNSNQNVRKFVEEAARRARLGKCFHRPSLGLREFDAHFELAEDTQPTFDPWNEDVGLMLYYLFDPAHRYFGFKFLDNSSVISSKSTKIRQFEGRFSQPEPFFFYAKVIDSRLDCHPKRVKIINKDGGSV